MAISRAGLDRLVETCLGTVRIEGILMHRLAWELYDLSPLLGEPAQRGANRMIPLNPGVVAYPPRRTQTRRSLPLLINGHWTPGDDYVSESAIWQQLTDNKEFLNDNVLLPTGTTGGTRTLEWVRPDSTTTTVEVQILPAQEPVMVAPAVLLHTLEILVPEGDLYA